MIRHGRQTSNRPTRRPALTGSLVLLVAATAAASPQWAPGVSTPPGLWERSFPGVAYDSARGQVVIFGGFGDMSYRDTWRYDGTAWTYATKAPPGLSWRYGHATVYDSARGRVVLFGGYAEGTNVTFNDTWFFDGMSWTLGPSAPAGLEPRWAHAMAYDSARDRVVLFGGETDNLVVMNDTWELDGSAWSAGPPAPAGLTPRQHSAMAYDSARGRLVLFGGICYCPANLFDETWLYDGTSWTAGPPAPPGLTPRMAAAMAFDSRRSVTVLYGGDGGTLLNDTWELDGVSWAPGAPAPPGLTAHAYHGMAYDSIRGVAVVFGGQALKGSYIVHVNETWEYDGSSWVAGASAPLGMRPRKYFGVAHDTVLGETIVWGGNGGSRYLGDTWHYDGAQWTAGPPATLASASARCSQ